MTIAKQPQWKLIYEKGEPEVSGNSSEWKFDRVTHATGVHNVFMYS